jgi:hypothetical protein
MNEILNQLLPSRMAVPLINIIDSYLPPINNWFNDVFNNKKQSKAKDRHRQVSHDDYDNVDDKDQKVAHLETDAKFWECVLHGSTTRVRYGKIGSAGRLGELAQFDDNDKARKNFDKQVR